MFDKQITPYQNVSILVLVSFAYQTILMPIVLSEVEGPVGWMAIIIGALLLYFMLKPINKLLDKHKGKTIINISKLLLPKPIFKTIGLYYIILFIIVSSWLIKDFAEQIKLLMLFNTPISLIIVIILLTASYAAKKGIQTIAQISHITVLLALVPYIAVIIFSAYYSDISNVLPVYPVDVEGIFKVLPYVIFGFLGYTVLLFSNSFVSKAEKNILLNKRFIIISTAIYVLCYLLIVIKFGINEAVRLVWPFLSIMKFVNIPGFFFESTEIVGMSFQIIVTFTCLCILMYFTNIALQETFETVEDGYFVFIQIPILYVMAAALPGMYMIYPYIRIPAYIFSGLNLLIPILIIFLDKRKKLRYDCQNK